MVAQAYLTGATAAPPGKMVTEPVDEPEQAALVVDVVAVIPALFETVGVMVTSQPLPAVTKIEYVPAASC